MTTIINATNDRRPLIDILNDTPIGGAIFDGCRFIRKTGYGRCKALDVRHFDHQNDGAQLAAFGAQFAMQAAWRTVYANELKRLAPMYLAEAHEMKMAAAAAERLAVAVRAAFIAGPLADIERQNQHGREMAQQADLDAMYAPAAGRWGY